MKFYIFIFSIFFLFGCAPEPKKSENLSILIKSPLLKLNDFGFKISSKNETILQIYSTGQGVLKIKISDKICINQACMSDVEFNKKFLLNEHYEGFFNDLVNANPIYHKKELEKTNCGFDQNISKIFVEYQICDRIIRFSDKKNGVKIVIKRLE